MLLEKNHLVSAVHSISTFSSIISLRPSNLFLIELMFKYEMLILLWLWVLRDFNPSSEIFRCLWVFLSAMSLVCLDEAYPYLNMIYLLLSIKDKPLLLQKRWSFSLILAISLKSWLYLLSKFDLTTSGGFCSSYSSISFTNLLIFFTIFHFQYH